MATWELSTEYKKSSIERQFWYKDDKVIIREEGYRWGTFTVQSDVMPISHKELIENDEYEVSYIDNDECWELVDLCDGCWADTEAGRNCTDEDLEAFNEAYEENWNEGVEELGWSLDECEYYMTGPLKLVNRDTGEEFSGLVDPTTIVHKFEMPTVEVNGVVVDLFKDDTPPLNLKQTAKWPFDNKPVQELTDWFPVSIKPVRNGLYDCEVKTAAWPFPQVKRLEWLNTTWFDEGSNVVDIKEIIQWRGLAKDPGAK